MAQKHKGKAAKKSKLPAKKKPGTQKGPSKSQVSETRQREIREARLIHSQHEMIRQALVTFVIAAVFLTLSILLNSGTIPLPQDLIPEEGADPVETWKIAGYLIKGAVVGVFFLFAVLAVGNAWEERGKPMTWKELLILFLISVTQSVTSGEQFAVNLLVVTLVLTYIYFIQGRIQERFK